jgi:ribosome maturation protein Sdo1
MERKKQGLVKYCKRAERFEILIKQNWGVETREDRKGFTYDRYWGKESV